MREIDLDDIDQIAGSRRGKFRVSCPVCGPSRSTAARRKLKVLCIWRYSSDFATYACAHCELRGYAADFSSRARSDPQELARLKAEATACGEEHAKRQQRKAQWLFGAAVPAAGTIVERYLRSRRISILPPTIRFLPPRKAGQHPAMVVPFGIPDEPEPGVLNMPIAANTAVQLTFLAADGNRLPPWRNGPHPRKHGCRCGDRGFSLPSGVTPLCPTSADYLSPAAVGLSLLDHRPMAEGHDQGVLGRRRGRSISRVRC